MGGWQWIQTKATFYGPQQTLVIALLMVLLVLQMKLCLLDQLIEWDSFMQLMQRVGRFCGPTKQEEVSMEACQLATVAYMLVMDIM